MALLIMYDAYRYAEEKMAEALDSTGRAVLLSAITTIIGFISLALTPVRTNKLLVIVGHGDCCCLCNDNGNVPNLTMMLDHKRLPHTLLPKPSLPLAYLLTGLN